MNLISGVLCDDDGKTSVLPSVKAVQHNVAKHWGEHPFSPKHYTSAIQRLVFGESEDLHYRDQLVTVQAPGGTGALRLALDFYAQQLKGKRVWIGTPCWSNYRNIADAARVEPVFFDHAQSALDFEQQVRQAKPYDAVLLQSGPHNPTGSMYTCKQWEQIADVCHRRKLLPILDNACQGLGLGIDEDRLGVQILSRRCSSLIVATSYSKNFTLYNEQVGALSLKVAHSRFSDSCLQALCSMMRSNYASPSQYGASIVSGVLNDSESYLLWKQDLSSVRVRLERRKREFYQRIGANSAEAVTRSKGLFFQIPMSSRHITRLREEHGIYMLDNGRISLAALTPKVIDRVAASMHQVQFK